jgi:hypothetical protein
MSKTENKDTPIGQSIAKKLSIKGLGWDKAALLKLVMTETNSEHFICRIVGVATQPRPYKIKEGERQGQVGFGLIGQFEGTNGVTGETLTSAVCYLPEYATEMVLGALGSSDDVVSVNIAFDIYAAYDEKAATSYTFVVRDLLNQAPQGIVAVKNQLGALPMPPASLALPSS